MTVIQFDAYYFFDCLMRPVKVDAAMRAGPPVVEQCPHHILGVVFTVLAPLSRGV